MRFGRLSCRLDLIDASRGPDAVCGTQQNDGPRHRSPIQQMQVTVTSSEARDAGMHEGW